MIEQKEPAHVVTINYLVLKYFYKVKDQKVELCAYMTNERKRLTDQQL